MTSVFAAFCLMMLFLRDLDTGWRLTIHGFCSVQLLGPSSPLLRLAFACLLSLPPAAVAAVLYWGYNRGHPVEKAMTGRNFCSLSLGCFLGLINASLYDPLP